MVRGRLWGVCVSHRDRCLLGSDHTPGMTGHAGSEHPGVKVSSVAKASGKDDRQRLLLQGPGLRGAFPLLVTFPGSQAVGQSLSLVAPEAPGLLLILLPKGTPVPEGWETPTHWPQAQDRVEAPPPSTQSSRRQPEVVGGVSAGSGFMAVGDALGASGQWGHMLPNLCRRRSSLPRGVSARLQPTPRASQQGLFTRLPFVRGPEKAESQLVSS